ncbi:hypothetical protein AVEN_244597-1 [Araneus ventricosus]|uniref:Uncharacterized protein n=1 Tax=Araneus ventricosus TaxID=182803 RepID=A0A4Y2TN30_ARAVE|nr:hypothetical protein AVEN_244597-1 [Araneus ventricosus]
MVKDWGYMAGVPRLSTQTSSTCSVCEWPYATAHCHGANPHERTTGQASWLVHTNGPEGNYRRIFGSTDALQEYFLHPQPRLLTSSFFYETSTNMRYFPEDRSHPLNIGSNLRDR